MLNKIKKIFNFGKVKNLTGSLKFKKDGWMNFLTGLGQPGRDKTTATCFRSCPVFSFVELDELYRSDGLTRRIIDVVVS